MSSDPITVSERELASGPVAHAPGTESAAPIDFIFLVDLSGSFGDDLPNFVASAPSIAAQLLSINEDSRFAIASFVDLPEDSFGSDGDYVYNADLALTDNAADFQDALAGLEISSGGDFPESQLPALFYAASGVGLDLREDSRKIVLVVTDAAAHTAEDYGLTTDDEVRAFLNEHSGTRGGPASGLEFPEGFSDGFVSAISEVLGSDDVVPIFAVTEGATSEYDGYVSELGVGATAPLSSSGDNVSDALSYAIADIAGSITEEGDGGTDRITGASGSDSVFGLDGEDTLGGGSGDDFIDGGSDDDTVSGGPGDDTLRGGTGDDVLNGGAGNDVLEPGLGSDEVFVGAGDDRISGAASELDGTTVNGFHRGDAVVVRIANMTEDDFSVYAGADGGTVMEIDANRDGLVDATLTFDTVFDKDDLTIETAGFDTIILRPYNLPPSDILLSTQVVTENSLGGTVVGELTTIDPDEDDAHTYSMANDAGGRFTIENDRLVVAEGAVIDYESERTIDVAITTTDRAGASLTLDFTIEVENVFESEILDVERFFNKGNGAHFLTASATEAAEIGASMPRLAAEGIAFRALEVDAIGTVDGAGSVPVYRFYNASLGTHFYTASAPERDYLVAHNSKYTLEGVAFSAFQDSGAFADLEEVYRLYNMNTGRHHWTMSEAEVASLDRTEGWVTEGIAFYAFEKDFEIDTGETGQVSAMETLERAIEAAQDDAAWLALEEDMFV